MADGELDTDPEPGTEDEFPEYGQMADQLSHVIDQGEQAGQQMRGLREMRKALRRTAKSVTEAEQRGLERGRAEQLTDEARQQLQAEFLQQLRAEDSHARSLRRLGIPEELRSLFDALPADDFQAWEAKASELRSKGISWSTDPAVTQERSQAAQIQQAAAQVLANGGQVDPNIFAALPAETRAQVVAAQTASMQTAQAGGQASPPPASTLDRLQQQLRRGEMPRTREQAAGLADEVNAELETHARHLRGEW